MGVTIGGLSSVADRTIYTNRGPIVKRPLDLLTGADLMVVGPSAVSSGSGPFTPSHEGKLLRVSGSPSGRNDGTFVIKRVVSAKKVELEASLDHSDVALTTQSLADLANELKDKYNAHRVSAAHMSPDSTNVVSAPFAVDLTSSLTMVNQVREKLLAHAQLVLPGPVHLEPDDDLPEAGPASTLGAAIHLANDLRRKLELHRQDDAVHSERDQLSRMVVPPAAAVTGSGPLCGPFTWTVVDPRPGQIADDPADVSVTVNAAPAEVEAVFGLLGAVVLRFKPTTGDTVLVDYDYLVGPGTQIQRLNSPEFNLNQAGNLALSGFPGHQYRAKAVLMDPSDPRLVVSAFRPRRTGWKYKALQRAYTAVLNDPTTLLLNVPTNRLTLPVLDAPTPERTLRYDPSSMPQSALDPWTPVGSGTAYLVPGGRELVIPDEVAQFGPESRPPFYVHPIDVSGPSSVHCAFRLSSECSVYDGVHAGPGFGFSDGARMAFAGLLLTDATNLSSAIVMANGLRSSLSSHLVEPGVHLASDSSDSLDVVPAKDLTSLLILANRVKLMYNRHVAKGPDVHSAAGAAVATADAETLAQAVALVNELRTAFNAHIASAVHNSPDSANSVGQVKQVGLLKAGGPPQLVDSWECSASDWSAVTTYRVSKAPGSTAYLYEGGGVAPLAGVAHSSLPAPSDVDLQLDQVQQAFFGSMSRGAGSVSRWGLVRVNVAPTDARLIGDNKYVDYTPVLVPEAQSVSPWITVGQGGYDRVASGKLLLDSTSVATADEVESLGLLGGAYRGFMRLEPMLTPSTACSVEFSASVGYATFGVDSRVGVLLDDGEISTHLCFIQASPSPAVATGAFVEPFGVSGGDTVTVALGDAAPVTVTFAALTPSASAVCSALNDALRASVASVSGGRVVLTSVDKGADAKLVVVGGAAAEKVGLRPGTYFGSDTREEPKVSWFGADLPDGEVPAWIPGGGEQATMLGRSMRITDSGVGDFRVYSFAEPAYLSSVLSGDWKLDARMSVLDWTPSDPVVTGSNLRFAGALVSVDEGPYGKNVELHLAADSVGTPYVNVLTYSASLDQLVSVAELPFSWDDGGQHVLNLYTSKSADLCIVLGDGVALGSFPYSSLQYGPSGPSVTFGSGANQVANADLRGSTSTVDWASVCVFGDSKVSDPSAPSARYVGLYRGGDASRLSSYYLHQVDWSSPHVYRLVRDPSSTVALYVDGADVPSVSVNYDVLSLPLAASSFLRPLTDGRSVVAFGAFDPYGVSRTSWSFVRYSMGRITLDERKVVGRQVLFQGHVVASPEHLRSGLPHGHFGGGAYSEGVPDDDFMADPDLVASTTLLDWTPPVPVTQDLASRGGLNKVVTPASSVSVGDYVNTRGFLSDLEDDLTNLPSVKPVIQYVVDEANLQLAMYEQHRVSRSSSGGSPVSAHLADDAVNVPSSPAATDLPTAYALLADLKACMNAHPAGPGVHLVPSSSTVASPGPATVEEAIDMIEEMRSVFRGHVSLVPPHKAPDLRSVTSSDPVGVDLPALVALAGEVLADYSAHAASLFQHEVASSAPTSPEPADLPTTIAALNEVAALAVAHAVDASAHHSADAVLSVASPAAFDYASAVARAVELKAVLNAHFSVGGTHEYADPSTVPATTVSTLDPSMPDPTVASVNDLLERFNRHLTQYRVHSTSDPGGASALAPATTEAEAYAVANDLKALFNLHLSAVVGESNRVHVADDAVNSVSAPDATDLASLRVLDLALWGAMSAHVVEPGVHGGTVFVRLEAPDRVLYEHLKLFTGSDGDEGQVSPFSDDEAVATLYDTATLETVIIRY